MKILGLSFKKDFEKKYSLIFKINDLLDTGAFSITTDYFDENTGYNYYMDYEGRRRSRTYNLTFQYKFGAYKEKKFKRDSDGHDHDGGDMMGY